MQVLVSFLGTIAAIYCHVIVLEGLKSFPVLALLVLLTGVKPLLAETKCSKTLGTALYVDNSELDTPIEVVSPQFLSKQLKMFLEAANKEEMAARFGSAGMADLATFSDTLAFRPYSQPIQ
jgi:hypothetical protein